MSNFRRIALVLLVVAAVAAVMGSFKGSDVPDRAIILGLGVDAGDNGGILLTAEVVSPGNGTEQVGTFSKNVTVQGPTINVALQNVAELTGKEASLGQCVVVLLGEEYYQTVHFADLTDYLINHHSLKESAVICCCEGGAKQLLDKGNALSQSMSLAIGGALQQEAKRIAIGGNSLLKFARSQNEMDGSGFLNKVRFVPSANTDAQLPDKQLGYISYREMCVFRDSSFVAELSEQQVKGLSLFTDDVIGETFVSFCDELTRTVQVTAKSVSRSTDDNGGTDIGIELTVRFGRSDSEDISGMLTPKNDKEIPAEVIEDVTRQAQLVAQRFLDEQVRNNFDLLGIREAFRRKQGTSEALAATPMSQFPVRLTVTVKEE